MDHSLDDLLGSDSDRSVELPPRKHGAPSASPMEFLQLPDLGHQALDNSIDGLLGTDLDLSVEVQPHVRGAPSVLLLDSPPSLANIALKPQEEVSNHPGISAQWLQYELSMYYREPAIGHRKAL